MRGLLLLLLRWEGVGCSSGVRSVSEPSLWDSKLGTIIQHCTATSTLTKNKRTTTTTRKGIIITLAKMMREKFYLSILVSVHLVANEIEYPPACSLLVSSLPPLFIHLLCLFLLRIVFLLILGVLYIC